MLTNFLSDKNNLNLLIFVLVSLLTFTVSSRFNWWETIVVLALIGILCVIIRIRGIADGMLTVKDDLLIKEFLKAIKSNADKTTKK